VSDYTTAGTGIQKVQNAATSDPDVLKFVSKFLDTEQKHLDRAQGLLNKMRQ
jgi:hypothetical protein